MQMSSLIPSQFRLLAVGLLAASLFGAGWLANGWRLGGQLADYRLQIAERDRRAEAAARVEEHRRQTEFDRITGEANDQAEQARADAADADQRADSLQQHVARLLASRGATCGAIAAQGGAPARDPAVLLADLLGRVEQAGRELAAEADRRAVAGRACERAYGALRE